MKIPESRHFKKIRDAKEMFDKNIESLRSLGAIHEYLEGCQVQVLEIDEILRAQYVLAVSAMDHYIHEITRESIMISIESEDSSDKLKNISVPLNIVKKLLELDSLDERRKLLDGTLKERLNKNTYQSPRKISEAFTLMGTSKIWSKLCKNTGKVQKDVEDQLDLIVNRRNQIAHEADIDFQTQKKRDINRQTISDCVTHIVWIVDRIDIFLHDGT